ncbi:hypothetical protein Tco_0906844 [Tanacetum coccineum]|uniref:Uncharacterized protein n=1 Tax=Tanacetum coccineum TaxID=301880 RepID=A0ABQ5CIP5_9ASTR
MKYEDIRPIFERVWDQNQSFVPMDSELEVQRLKRAGQDIVEELAKSQRTEEASGSVQEQTGEEPKAKELSQEQLHKMIMVIPVEEVYVEALQERFRTTEPTEDKARELWVELKRSFEMGGYMIHVVFSCVTEEGHDIYMLVEKDYPLTKSLATLMLCNKLRVDQYYDMVDELLQKINIIANRPS